MGDAGGFSRFHWRQVSFKLAPMMARVLLVLLLFGRAAQAFAEGANEIPLVHFTDITRQAGIQFSHNNGATGDKLLPETMGGGVAFFDFDNDGNQDLLFINSTW